MNAKAPKETLEAGALPFLISALAVGLIPHLPHLNPWIPLWCIGLWGYALVANTRGWPLPRPLLRTVLTFGGCIAAFITSGGAIDNAFGASLLCVMAGLKVLEIRRERDLFNTVCIAYFMVVSSLFFSASLPMILYMALAILEISAVLIRVHCPGTGWKKAAGLSGAITAKAIPLALVLFFFFPRIDGNILGITPSKGATSGFTDTLSPGSVSRLTQKRTPVFRVTFNGATPAPAQRYFRGIVFQTFDGKSWRVTRRPPKGAPIHTATPSISYEMRYETSSADRLFPLDLPMTGPPASVRLGDYTLRIPRGGLTDAPYTFRSATAHDTGPLAPWEALFSTLPATGNPQSRMMAQRWRSEATGPEALIDRALSYFASQGFSYTLSPPTLGKDPVDGFLFDSRRGFCEHYASAFTFLMRAAGIPARIVGGYLGGTVNPFGGYLIVRQSDAHAWVEVWTQAGGWKRVDPTAVVAPDRMDRGAGFGLPEVERPTFFLGDSASAFTRGLRRFTQGWDAVNHAWNSRIIGYSFSLQSAFLKRLGIPTLDAKGWIKSALWFLAICGILLGIFWALLEFKGRKSPPSPQASWTLFQKKLQRQGIVRPLSMGPATFLAAIKKSHPQLYPEAGTITRLYVELTYGNKGEDGAKQRELKRAVNRFAPGKRGRQTNVR